MPSPPEEFNDRVLRPELSQAQLQRLHAELQHIYQTYCLDESVDKINFDTSVVEEIRSGETTLLAAPGCFTHPGSSQWPKVPTAAW